MKKTAFLFLPLLCLVACSSSRNANEETPKENYLKTVSVQNMEFLDSTGQAWDNDGSGPDVYFELYELTQTKPYVVSPVKNNVKQGDLPLEWQLDVNNSLLTGSNWRLTFYDQDDKSKQQMASFEFGGNTTDDVIHLAGAHGTVYKIDLQLEKH